MKKSSKVTLTVVAAMGLVSCGRKHPDPCEAATFNEQACQEAVQTGGYYHHGTWVPMIYHYPFPYYYDHYRTYVGGGGVVRPEPGGAYVRGSGSGTPSPSAPAAGGVERGGFGSTGASHSSGGGE